MQQLSFLFHFGFEKPLMEHHYDFYESFSLVAARMTALAISETPTSIIIVAQDTNHVVVSIRNVLIR